jgi:hypothetical protein
LTLPLFLCRIIENTYSMDREKVKLIIVNMEFLIRSLKEELENDKEYKYEEISPYTIDEYEPNYYEEDD